MIAVVYTLAPLVSRVVSDLADDFVVVLPVVGALIALVLAIRMVRYFSAGARFARWERDHLSDYGRSQ